MIKNILLIGLFLNIYYIYGETKNSVINKSISTKNKTKDWVISDYIVTDPKFGAKPIPGYDNRTAFQAAIDSAYNNGGGVVYIPAGNYEFHSTKIGQKKVRVRKGEKEIIKPFNYEYVLTLPAGVQLRGDWIDPQKNNNKINGTILEVYPGKNSFNHDGKIESWWNDSQANNILHKSFTSIADRFIEMNEGTGVTNMAIWYPEQNINEITPYPWTLFQAKGDCATIENVTLVNSYNGFYSAPSELHYLKNCHITALNKGLEIHVCTDIGRIENVNISTKYWANSGLKNSPDISTLKEYTRTHSTGFKMHRSDWEYIYGLGIEDCKIGLWIGKEPGFSDSPNSQLLDIHINQCENSLYIEDVNPYGLLISNSSFGALKNGNAVYLNKDFHTIVQFNGVTFNGRILNDGKSGIVSFESCNFNYKNKYNIHINSGNILLSQCRFRNSTEHVFLGQKAKSLRALNSGYKGKLTIKKTNKDTRVDLINDKKYYFKPIPQNLQTDINKYPKPKSNNVIRASFPRVNGFNNKVPEYDISLELQSELNKLEKNGGGTLYLPAGRYLLNKPIVIPSGVELRGSWDVQHHTQSGGTALFTNYDGGQDGENGVSLIQLKDHAGIKGLNIVQHNIISEGYSIENPRKTPFLIQGKGKGVYVINVTVSIGDKGLDLASFDTSGHYIDFFAGVLLRAGIWVGGGSNGGFIRNMQFNPHYSARLPKGGQGYPNAIMTKFLQSNCSALKFSDISNQTIFNNFVYGSVYGIHFLKDKLTSKYPENIIMLGHGSDGCTFSLFVEDANKNTNIIAINSELVNTNIKHQPIRSYILMGEKSNTSKISSKSRLTLYNSAFWGSPVFGSIVNNGILRIQQGNFTHCGHSGIEIQSGKAYVYTTYFAQPIKPTETYLKVHSKAKGAEFINNYYRSNFSPKIFNTNAISGMKLNYQ